MTSQFDFLEAHEKSAGYANSGEVNFRTVDEFPAREQIRFAELLSLSLRSNTAPFTHGLHRFPAKFIPQIPRWAIQQVSCTRPLILDPFMGSGTSLVEGLRRDCTVLGIDVDVLATLIASAKIANYDVSRLRQLGSEVCSRQGSKPTNLTLPMADVKQVFHWFTPRAFSDLCVIFESINDVRCTLEERKFLICVFSSILRQVSNADDQTQKTYVSHTLVKQPPKVWQTFKNQFAKALKKVDELSRERKGRAHALVGSATALPLKNDSADLIVTSPPYIDSVDYMYNLMLEYFWLGPALGVHDRKEFNRLRRNPIGAKKPTKDVEFPSSLQPLVTLNSISEYRREATSSYFARMQTHFAEAARVLKPGARYVLVIGNSATSGDTLPVHDCLVHLASQTGLQLEHAFGYRIRRHYMKFPRKGRGGIILMDWVVTLRKTSRSVRYSPLPLLPLKIGDNEVAN